LTDVTDVFIFSSQMVNVAFGLEIREIHVLHVGVRIVRYRRTWIASESQPETMPNPV
jgi:hypothetical protein